MSMNPTQENATVGRSTVCIGFAVIAAVLVAIAIVVVPHATELRKAAELKRTLEILDENRSVCEKWGMKSGTREYEGCTTDLNAIRSKQEQRQNADAMGFL